MAQSSRMAFWTGAPDSGLDPVRRIRDLIRKMPLFEGIETRRLFRFLPETEWFSLPAGWTLLSRGQPSEALYLITAGCVGLWLTDAQGEDYLASEFVAGQTVGEPGLISGEPRMGTLVALRDTEVIRVPRATFDRIVARHPAVMANMSKLLVRRLKNMSGAARPAHGIQPKTIAVVPVTPGVCGRTIGERMLRTFTAAGLQTILLDTVTETNGSEWFHRLEAEHDHLIYVANPEHGSWTRMCLRQADRVILVGRSDALSAYSMPIEQIVFNAPRRFTELVILHPENARYAHGALPWLERFRPVFHYNLRLNDPAGLDRLTRHIMGRATGMVLSGGGARGFAHLGVLKALREAGVTIDRFGGTSIGAIVGGGIAAGWTIEELTERMRRSFVETNPLSDYTVPFVSLIRGRKIARLLHESFEGLQIEDLWLTYFCVSADLTHGKQVIHRRGLLWQALRASVSIPGIIAPVIRRGAVLVDGAVMNNFPASLMADQARGPVIGSDVEDHDAFRTIRGRAWRMRDWGILGDDVKGGPGIVSLLMRSGTVNSEMQTNRAHQRTELLFSPTVEGIGLTDWKAFDRSIEAGYTHAARILENADLSALTGVKGSV